MFGENYLYFGSCRYMNLFSNHYPGRLHTTKEIIQFLTNKPSREVMLKNDDANFQYGDINNEIVSKIYAKCNITYDVKNLVLEISTNKYYVFKNMIYNKFYYDAVHKGHLHLPLIQSHEDIIEDLKIIKSFFNNDTKIFIITHYDGYVNNQFIGSRHSLVQFLVSLNIENVKIINVTNSFGKIYNLLKITYNDKIHYKYEYEQKIFKYVCEQINA